LQYTPTRCARRYLGDGRTAAECVYHVSLKEIVEALISTPAYASLLDHENVRRSNPTWASDVYDTPAWKEAMGPPTSRLSRIGFLFCVDGIPAFKKYVLLCVCHVMVGSVRSALGAPTGVQVGLSHRWSLV
jgi:hypothetical protein